MSGSALAIELDSVSWRVDGRPPVNGVGLEVPAGAVLGLVGPPEAGTGSLLDLISTLVRPRSGSIRVMGLDADRNGAEIRSRLGVVPAGSGAADTARVDEDLRLFARAHRVAAIGEKVAEVLELVDLGELANARCSSLTANQRRRLGWARALVHDPALVLFDRPLAGADDELRGDFADLVAVLRARGVTSVIGVASALDLPECDLIAVMAEGRLVEQRGGV